MQRESSSHAHRKLRPELDQVLSCVLYNVDYLYVNVCYALMEILIRAHIVFYWENQL